MCLSRKPAFPEGSRTRDDAVASVAAEGRLCTQGVPGRRLFMIEFCRVLLGALSPAGTWLENARELHDLVLLFKRPSQVWNDVVRHIVETDGQPMMMPALAWAPLVTHRDTPSTTSVPMVSPSDCSTRSSSSGWSSSASSGPPSPRLRPPPTSDGLDALRGASPRVTRPDLGSGPLARGAPTPELAGPSPPTPRPSFAAKLQQGMVAVQLPGEAPPSLATPASVASAQRSPVHASSRSSGLTYKEQPFCHGTHTWEHIPGAVRRDILEPRLENNHLSKAHFNASIVRIIMGMSRDAVVSFMKRVPTKAGLIRNPNHKMEKLMMHLLRDVINALIHVHDKLPPVDDTNTCSRDTTFISADCASVQCSSSASGSMSTSSSTNSLSSLTPATASEVRPIHPLTPVPRANLSEFPILGPGSSAGPPFPNLPTDLHGEPSSTYLSSSALAEHANATAPARVEPIHFKPKFYTGSDDYRDICRDVNFF
ncbi:MAG: hypothetical protein WDW36_005699 [Sanguina aurantia]